MKNKIIFTFAIVAVCFGSVLNVGCTNTSTQKTSQTTETAVAQITETAVVQANTQSAEKTKPLVTFIELGSVRCIPCQQMVPIMEAVEEKYGDQIEVIFYDVWTPEGKPYGDKYGIRAIPTQVFLDENGEEFFRHVGFFPQDELEAVLKSKGVKE